MRAVSHLQRTGSFLAEGRKRTFRQDAFPFRSDHRLSEAFRPQAIVAGIQGHGLQGRGVSQPVGLLASALGSHDRRAAQNAARPRAAGLAAGADDLSTAVRASRAVTSLRRVHPPGTLVKSSQTGSSAKTTCTCAAILGDGICPGLGQWHLATNGAKGYPHGRIFTRISLLCTHRNAYW